MQRSLLFLLLGCLLLAVAPAQAQTDKEAKIESAMSAAPPSIAAAATIMDWPAEEGGASTTLRKGSNDWTCFPDMPGKAGTSMCPCPIPSRPNPLFSTIRTS